MASRHERLLRLTERTIARGVRNRSGQIRIEDEHLEGPFITVDGNRLVDFGSCSYLALNRHPDLKAAAVDAVNRFGTSHSSSPMYTALGLYSALEQRLEQIFEAPVAVAPTTTLAHLAALPVLVGPEDLLLVDQFAHASTQLAADVLRGRGTRVEITPHNDVAHLRVRLSEEAQSAGQVWYVADGVYSMLGDVAPVAEIQPLLDEFPKLHIYYDDAHGFGWEGKHGRGFVLDKGKWHPRMVLSAGLAKSFGTTGGVLAFGDPAVRQRIQYTGGPFTFSGPIQPASLGASIASADIHLSAQHHERRQLLQERIDLAKTLLTDYGLPTGAKESTPIWFIVIGQLERVLEITRGVMDDGYYVNPASYPAVPMGLAGIRFTQTLHQTEEQLEGLVASLLKHLSSGDGPDLTVDITKVTDVASASPAEDVLEKS